MKIIYEAFDGTHFDKESDCTDYEWRLNHPLLKNILIYGEDLVTPIKNIFLEENYFNCYKVIVHNADEVQTLHDLANYTGYSNLYEITESGTWLWKKENLCWRFVKQ